MSTYLSGEGRRVVPTLKKRFSGEKSRRKLRENGDFYGFRSAGVFPYDESNAFTADWQQLTPVFENGIFQ